MKKMCRDCNIVNARIEIYENDKISIIKIVFYILLSQTRSAVITLHVDAFTLWRPNVQLD